MPDLSSEKKSAGAPDNRASPRSLFAGSRASGSKGSVLFYIFIAVGLLAALSYSFVRDSRQNVGSQLSYRAAEELFVQLNVIRSAVMECALEYPGGAGDVDLDGDIDETDNPNNPYPLHSSNVNITNAPAGCATTSSAAGCISSVGAADFARELKCTGAPIGKTNIFQGANNKGRVLPPPPPGFGEWVYFNNASGVYLTIDASSASAIDALSRLASKFAECQAEMADSDTFLVWIQRASCP